MLKCAYPAEAYKFDQAGMTDANGKVRTVGAGFMVMLAQAFANGEELIVQAAVKRLCATKSSMPSIADIRREADKWCENARAKARINHTQMLLAEYDRRSEDDVPEFFTALIERMKAAKRQESAK